MRPETRIGLSGIVLGLAVGLAIVGPGAAAAGEPSFAFGVGFAVGGTSFQIAYPSPAYGYVAGYAPHYFRTPTPLRYEGFGCASGCFKASGYWYHVPSCGLVRYHFSYYGFAAQGYYPYGPSPGHYLPFYGRQEYGHQHRVHGYISYQQQRYYQPQGYYPPRVYGGSRGYVRGHGHRSWSPGHRGHQPRARHRRSHH